MLDAFYTLLAALYIASPALLLLALILGSYKVFLKKERFLIWTAILFLSCGILGFREMHLIETPAKAEQRYLKSVKILNSIVETGSDNIKDKMYRELYSLTSDSNNAYIDYVNLIELQKLIDKGEYHDMLSTLDKSYKDYQQILTQEFNNKTPLQNYIRLTFLAGFWASLAVMVLFIYTLFTEKAEA